MNKFEFSSHLLDHIHIGVLYALVCVAVNVAVMRRYIYSVFDPLLFYTVLSGTGGSVVLYLYHFDLIRPIYLWSYVGTQIAFTSGFLMLRPPAAIQSVRPTLIPTYTGPIQALYPLSVTLFIICQLAVYIVTGLPIFLESRLEAFAGGDGFGLLSRVIYVTSSIALVCAFYRLALLPRGRLSRALDCSVIAVCVAVAVVSGSKGALLALVFSVSLALFFARRYRGTARAEQKVRRFFVFVVLLAFPAAFTTIYFQSGIDSFSELVTVVWMRFFQTGDIFFMLYPDEILNRLQHDNGLLALLYSPLGSLRLVPRESLPVNLGLQAFWYHYDTTLLSGPNARHNVFGLFYFGPWLSVMFSFMLGLAFSVARNSTYRKLPSTPIGMNLYVLVASSSMFIEQDVSGQALEYLFSVVLVFPVLYVISYCLVPYRVRPPQTVQSTLDMPPISPVTGVHSHTSCSSYLA